MSKPEKLFAWIFRGKELGVPNPKEVTYFSFDGDPSNTGSYKKYILYSRVASLFDAIKHGDQAHQDWLKKAIEDHFK